MPIRAMYVYNKNKDLLAKVEYPTMQDITENLDAPNVMWFAYVHKSIQTSEDTLYLSPEYNYKHDGLIYYTSYNWDNGFGGQGSDYRNGQITDNDLIKIENINQHNYTHVYIKPNKNSVNAFKGSNEILTISYDKSLDHDIIEGGSKMANYIKVYNYDINLTKKLKGQILLQVESKGEAYYIYPEDNKRYNLGRPADAFNVMRKLGLGATHDFIASHTIYPTNVLGKILLDVERNGEAYYIYPKDKKAYYLGRPTDAFRIMRELGLGITNNDLSKIPEGNL